MTDPQVDLRTLEVRKTARYALLGKPSSEVRELWIAVHGYRQLAARFARRFYPITAPHRLIAVPEALNRFYVGDPSGRHGPEVKVGGTWMTREARELEIRDYVAYLDDLASHLRQELTKVGAPEARVVVLGFSQGVHTVARWSSMGQTRADEILFWGEYLPGDLDKERAAAAWADARLYFIRGEADSHHREAHWREEFTVWGRSAGAAEGHLHPDGHRIDAGLLDRLAEAISERTVRS